MGNDRGGSDSGSLKWFETPEVQDPVLFVAFSGWNDAGSAASAAVKHLERAWQAQPFAGIDAEEYFDFAATRPSVELTGSGGRRIVWPETLLLAAPAALGNHGALLALGVEPQLKWRTFADTLLGVIKSLDVSMVISLGAFLADVPHTRATVVYGAADGTDLFEGLRRSNYEGPTGILGVLQSACAVHGVPFVSLWAAVPTYVPGAISPKAALALLKRLCIMFDLDLPLHDLEAEASEYVRQVNSFVVGDIDTVEFIAELERHYDENHEGSPEQLVAEVEQFLRRRGE